MTTRYTEVLSYDTYGWKDECTGHLLLHRTQQSSAPPILGVPNLHITYLGSFLTGKENKERKRKQKNVPQSKPTPPLTMLLV